MILRKVDSDRAVVDYLVVVIERELSKKERVLWLVSGGSCVAVAVQVSQRLKPDLLKNLAVTLVDERYGPIGHADSNWHQLEEAGFALPGAMLLPVLRGGDIKNTTDNFDNLLQKLFENAKFSIGLFGIGPDGHTSGILPGSPAVTASGLATFYDGGSYQRITTTPSAITRLDEAVVYAMGEAKWPVLDRIEEDVPLSEQPAQVLKQVSKLTIFNDHKGRNT